MSESNNPETTGRHSGPERVPADRRPGHEQEHEHDPIVDTTFEDATGLEWFAVGNSVGVLCTRDPVEVVR